MYARVVTVPVGPAKVSPKHSCNKWVWGAIAVLLTCAAAAVGYLFTRPAPPVGPPPPLAATPLPPGGPRAALRVSLQLWGVTAGTVDRTALAAAIASTLSLGSGAIVTILSIVDVQRLRGRALSVSGPCAAWAHAREGTR